jgi:chemotaxis-related protein WspD
MTDAVPQLPSRRPDSAGLDALLARPLSEPDLDRATAELAVPIDLREGSRLSVLAFRTGGELVAVPAAEACRVIAPTTVHRVPHRSNAVFLGIANHDGEILLCASIEAALGLAPRAVDAPPAAFVVAENGRERWAFGVDAVVGVVDVAESALRSPPLTVSAARSGCVRTLARIEGGEAIVLDVGALFALLRGATS